MPDNDRDPGPTPAQALDACVAYYEAHAEQFQAETTDLDLEHVFARFLPHIPPGGAILEAGCGAGRDARHMALRGYRVEAFDASPAMVRLARAHAGVPVRLLDFAAMDYPPRFHGVYANASLLHLPPAALPGVFQAVARALVPGGVLYAGLKLGRGHWLRRGVLPFWGHDEASLAALLAPPCPLRPVETWTTPDLRPGREGQAWLHCIARKA